MKCKKCGEIVLNITKEGRKALEDLGWLIDDKESFTINHRCKKK